ncbi:Arm DNA-binding domain-containing protein [Enterobacter roggenkampii]|uniref:Arm DNA-binding domain-containing protein n=1 Tax=Enterobacter roggenkampii TaxID=1812935 RepID=UPI00200561EA|nr:Arm DNA-binding domain-containing protein [Enterobacter roggenkampii]MCK7077640.1 Arm DNA-binding domain-containing protein [Enterobacter roggenkampii]
MSSPKRFRFTNQLIKSLPPNTSDSRSTDAEYSDTEISGLKCLVSKGEGRKKFMLRYLYHGRKRAIAIGHWPEVDVTLARKISMKHKRSVATAAVSLHNGMRIFILSAYRTPVSYWRKG